MGEHVHRTFGCGEAVRLRFEVVAYPIRTGQQDDAEQPFNSELVVQHFADRLSLDFSRIAGFGVVEEVDDAVGRRLLNDELQ